MTEVAVAGFGAGSTEPYARALRTQTGALHLHAVAERTRTPLDVARFLGEPDDVDARIARSVPGPVLDVGCGPGRMVRATLDAGREALGLDVSGAAVEIARGRGLPVQQGSVFEPVPREGSWQSVLLIDGNIGIGGDPTALLARCVQLLHPGGCVLIETHPDRRRDRSFEGVLRDAEGGSSLPFPWAEVGRRPLRRHARRAGLALVHQWRADGRHFARYAREGFFELTDESVA